jgi:UDP-2-acetamido-2,6-beta-L-arabino-hexul-4-ose reductase
LYIDDLILLILKTFNNVESENIIQISHKYEYKVSEILDVLNYFKNTYLIKGEIPSLSSDFNIQLFNTFRSYINNETFFPVKHKNNIDNRGNFVEIVRFNSSGQVSYSSSKPGIIRGNHFHTRKIERFSVIKGNAILQLRKVGSSEIHKYFLNGENPSFVDIPLWYIHNIVNIGDEDLYTVFWINEVFNPEDSDTHYENI